MAARREGVRGAVLIEQGRQKDEHLHPARASEALQVGEGVPDAPHPRAPYPIRSGTEDRRDGAGRARARDQAVQGRVTKGRRIRARAAPRAAGPTQSSLHVVAPSERLAALEREQRRLLRDIAQKKRSIERLELNAAALAAQVAASVQPLLEEHRDLCKEIHGLFEKLLGDPDRSFVRKRRKLEVVYRTLIELGLIGDAEDTAESDFGRDDLPPFAAGAGGYSASKETAGPGFESLRSVFRRLAAKLHPDRVRDEHEKLERTATMKELTRAYESGDLARLLELERNLAQTTTDASTSTDEARCANLERALAELRNQLRELSRDAKALKRSGPLAAVADFTRRPSDGPDAVVQELVADAEEDLKLLRELRDFVRAFHEKRISFDAFVAGPSFASGRYGQGRSARRRH